MKNINRVLLIDDNIHDNFIHTLTIKKYDASLHVDDVTSGEMALEFFAQCKQDPENNPVPDLVFLDINMPGMNGFEFLEKAKVQRIFENDKPHLVVMLTSSLNPSDENKAKEMFSKEIMEYKNKPLTMETLKQIIETYF